MSATRKQRGLAMLAAGLGLSLAAGPFAFSPAVASPAHKHASASAAGKHHKPKHHKKHRQVKLNLLAINDFHGALETGGHVGDVNAGGAAYLATHLDRMRARAKRNGAATRTVAAGDLIGASPLLSAAFHDEPTIEAMNMLDLDVTSVGNHEFDEGYRELLRMQEGGCLDDGPDGRDNQNSCPKHRFRGADFDYLAANVELKRPKHKTLFPPYKIEKIRGQKVGFIGLVLQDTPNIVTKSGVEGLVFKDEVKTVDRLVPELRAKGVQSIVVLMHEGGVPADSSDINACEDVTGPGMDIAKALNPEVDVVISGHTHLPYNCTVRDPNGHKRLFTSAYYTGRVVTELRLRINRANGDIIRSRSKAINHINTNDDGTEADPTVQGLIDRYTELVAPIANEVLGQIDPAASQNDLTRTAEADGLDSPVGNLIADAQKVDPSTIPEGGGDTPVIALMNPGGIRNDLVENADGDVTYGAAFSVQPFNNYVVSMDLTGQQVLDVLNEQWNGANESSNPGDPSFTDSYKVLQVSGLNYTWDKSDAAGSGSAIVGDVLVDEDGDDATAMTALDPTATYRVVVNSFLSDGGDGFGTLADGTDKFIGGLDIDSLADYLAANSPYTPTPLDRISNQD